MTFESTFWRTWYDWHLIHDLGWDARLQVEAMTMGIEGLSRMIGEELLPAMRKANDAMRGFAEAFAAAFREG